LAIILEIAGHFNFVGLPQMRGSGGYTPTENSATTGIGSTISNGKWKKKCTLKFRRGKWRCVKRRKKPNSAEAKN
jgi:hypothetical protein